MLHKRIAESVEYVGGEFFEFGFRQIKRGQQFVEHHAVDEAAGDVVVTRFAHRIQSAEVGHRRKHGVRAVEQRYFPVVVGFFARHKQYV